MSSSPSSSVDENYGDTFSGDEISSDSSEVEEDAESRELEEVLHSASALSHRRGASGIGSLLTSEDFTDFDLIGMEDEVPFLSPESMSTLWPTSYHTPEYSSPSYNEALRLCMGDGTMNRRIPIELTSCKLCDGHEDLSCCGGCFRVAYCSEEHQEEDWPVHEVDCINYSLKRSDNVKYQGPFQVVNHNKKGVKAAEAAVVGKQRFLLEATTKIPPKQKVFDESPILVCPWPRIPLRQYEDFTKQPWNQLVSLSCFGCGLSLGLGNSTNICCGTCNLPLCSSECPGIQTHKENECGVIKTYQRFSNKAIEKNERTKLLRMGMDEIEFLYEDVMMVRLIKYFMNLGEKEFGNPSGENLADGFKTRAWYRLLHIWKFDEELKLESIRGRIAREQISKVFCFSLHLTGGDQKLVWRLFCILESNTFSFNLPYKRFNVLCTLLPLLAHDCFPNTHVSLLEDASEDVDDTSIPVFLIRVACCRPTIKDSVITFSYVPTIYCTMERRLILLDKYSFWCRCERCLCQTEFQTHVGCFVCTDCRSTKMVLKYMSPSNYFVDREADPSPKSMAVSDLHVAEQEHKLLLSDERYDWSCADASIAGRHTCTTDIVCKQFFRLERDVVGCLGDYTRAGSMFNQQGTPLHNGHSILLKLCEDILRGDFFVHPAAKNLETVSSFHVGLISSAKAAMTEFMRRVNPNFTFQGYPIEIIELCEQERYRRSIIGPRSRIMQFIDEPGAAAAVIDRFRRDGALRSYNEAIYGRRPIRLPLPLRYP